MAPEPVSVIKEGLKSVRAVEENEDYCRILNASPIFDVVSKKGAVSYNVPPAGVNVGEKKAQGNILHN
jgi:hypothetical protein